MTTSEQVRTILERSNYSVTTNTFDAGQYWIITEPRRSFNAARASVFWGENVVDVIIRAMIAAGLYVPIALYEAQVEERKGNA